jgi:hypothetical protein
VALPGSLLGSLSLSLSLSLSSTSHAGALAWTCIDHASRRAVWVQCLEYSQGGRGQTTPAALPVRLDGLATTGTAALEGSLLPSAVRACVSLQGRALFLDATLEPTEVALAPDADSGTVDG